MTENDIFCAITMIERKSFFANNNCLKKGPLSMLICYA